MAMNFGLEKTINMDAFDTNADQLAKIVEEIDALEKESNAAGGWQQAPPQVQPLQAPPAEYRMPIRQDLNQGYIPQQPHFGGSGPVHGIYQPRSEVELRQEALFYNSQQNQNDRRRMIKEVKAMRLRLSEMGEDLKEVPQIDDMSSFEMVSEVHELVKAIFEKKQGVEQAKAILEFATSAAGFVLNGQRKVFGISPDLSFWSERLKLREKRVDEHLQGCGSLIKHFSSVPILSFACTLAITGLESYRMGKNINRSQTESIGNDRYFENLAKINNNTD
jgi:hypothetical protein